MTLALGPSWLDPGNLLNTYGIWGLLLVVFAESGLLIGFFLPGDSLLFTCGLLITSGDMDFPLWGAIALICVAAILGDQAGYMFGKKVGPSLFNRPDSRLFKQENVVKAHEFFEKHGPKSLVLARFVPVVRTFTPIIAGVSGMKYRSFLVFNVLGGVLWGAGVTLLGSWLGNIPVVRNNIEAMLILIVLISVVPIAIEFLRARSKERKARAEEPGQPEPVRTAQQSYPQPPAMDDATTRLRRIEPEPHEQPYEQPGHPEQQYWPQDYGQQPQQPRPVYGNQPNQPYGNGGYPDQGGYGQQGGQDPYYGGQQPHQHQQPQHHQPQYDGQGYGDPQQQYPYGYDQGGHRAP
ncbi:VTT domain-containing protein [Streptomyces sp. DSM 110735]|uniref:DedA family protein n=1 Tax=Streptomyces sp. DSM 110735 TaxID=2775031 RepID=UPI0018F77ECC|nr:VTT domain-containing protein [Streptomyces sp. DSM 110735]MBJ7906784.1 VTT domain-containing protein [Streptomyces sp. DSM 110735]